MNQRGAPFRKCSGLPRYARGTIYREYRTIFHDIRDDFLKVYREKFEIVRYSTNIKFARLLIFSKCNVCQHLM